MPHRLTEAATGVYIIAATPFTDDGALDLVSADRLIEFYLEKGVSGMTILGVMGEAPKLSPAESEQFLGHWLDRVDGRVPVIVGVSAPGMDNLARLARSAMDKGAAGVMAAPTPNLKTEAAIKGYFAQICAAIGPDTPLVYQDYPQLTNVHITADGVLDLVAAHPQIVMLKHEDCPGLNKLSRVRDGAAERGLRRISILCGNSALFLAQEMRRGADGAMTGFAYPEMLVEVVAKAQAGDFDAAEDLFDLYLPMVRYEQQPGLGLAIRKEVLRRRGVIASAALRAPGPKLTAADQSELTVLMQRLDSKLAARG